MRIPWYRASKAYSSDERVARRQLIVALNEPEAAPALVRRVNANDDDLTTQAAIEAIAENNSWTSQRLVDNNITPAIISRVAFDLGMQH